MKPSILFVDDEQNILDGLKRMLYPMRQQWDMTFSTSARHALQLLEKHEYDVLITDLIMPDMDGGQLLQEVHARFPRTIRMVLSGHPGTSLALKASRFAHQFLSKPLQPEVLTRIIRRVLSLRELLISPSVQELIAKLDILPALPEVHQQIIAELNSPEPSLPRVAELISKDMGLSASMMKLVNSAFFGLSTRVSSPAHAVNLLGLDVLSGLVLTTRLFSSFDAQLHQGYHLDHLWQHSLNTGLICRALAKAENLSQAEQDDLYIAGILHDVGKLILLSSTPKIYGAVLSRCRKENVAVWRSEKTLLHCTHADLGAYLLCLWGFSEKSTPWIQHHHSLHAYSGEHPLMAAIVHAANALDHELTVLNPDYEHNRWDMETLEHLGFAQRLPVWRQAAEAAVKEAQHSEIESPHR